MFIFLGAQWAMAAPMVSMTNPSLMPGDTAVDIDLFINTDSSNPVDSATFTLDSESSSIVSGVDIYSPNGWVQTITFPKFGSTDYGSPPNPIESDYKFATLHVDCSNLNTDSATIGFSFIELADPDTATAYQDVRVSGGHVSCNPVPVPPSALLMVSGLIGLVGLGKKRILR